MKILRTHESSFGQWYVQVDNNGIRLELSFDYKPEETEVEKVVLSLPKDVPIVDMQELTINEAVVFLEIDYAKIDLRKPDKEQAKIVEFINAKAEAVLEVAK